MPAYPLSLKEFNKLTGYAAVVS